MLGDNPATLGYLLSGLLALALMVAAVWAAYRIVSCLIRRDRAPRK